MASLALNKTSLKTERDRLMTYQRFLPSLDLKRQQLLAEYKKAQHDLRLVREETETLTASLEGLFRLMGAAVMDLSGYVKVRSVQIETDNILGVKLPVYRDIQVDVEEYSTLAQPFWIDTLIDCLRQICTLRIREQIQRQRVARLDEAVRRITQRVNLFGKVLIPSARKNIHRIAIYLADAERAGVVRSKIVKAKRRRQTA